jgi:hypothetical protein
VEVVVAISAVVVVRVVSVLGRVCLLLPELLTQ